MAAMVGHSASGADLENVTKKTETVAADTGRRCSDGTASTLSHEGSTSSSGSVGHATVGGAKQPDSVRSSQRTTRTVTSSITDTQEGLLDLMLCFWMLLFVELFIL
jgi:hypothetical protein